MKRPPVEFLTNPDSFTEKENRYLSVRQKEGRVLPDDMVRELPKVPAASPYKKEWKWRERSFTRFLKYLAVFGKKREKPIQVLDLGCGNGWMANLMARQGGIAVTAVDLNTAELEQGARLFGRDKVRFVYVDVFGGVLPKRHFDIILLAASVQYFPDLEKLIATLRTLLTEKGEIHIIDAHFYSSEKARDAARQRTLDYYSKVGAPEMAGSYHHHLLSDIKKLGGENLNEDIFIALFQRFGRLAPFAWIRIGGP